MNDRLTSFPTHTGDDNILRQLYQLGQLTQDYERHYGKDFYCNYLKPPVTAHTGELANRKLTSAKLAGTVHAGAHEIVT